jgi:hypothetical protein
MRYVLLVLFFSQFCLATIKENELISYLHKHHALYRKDWDSARVQTAQQEALSYIEALSPTQAQALRKQLMRDGNYRIARASGMAFVFGYLAVMLAIPGWLFQLEDYRAPALLCVVVSLMAYYHDKALTQNIFLLEETEASYRKLLDALESKIT